MAVEDNPLEISKSDEVGVTLEHERQGATTKRKVSLRWIRNIVFGLILLVLGIGVGYSWANVEQSSHGFSTPDFLAVGTGSEPTKGMDFSLFWKVRQILQDSYLEPEKIDNSKMVNGAIAGMTASLGDPYTVFLPPDDNKRTKEDLNGEFSGVGIQLGFKRDTIAVMSPLDEMPAIKKGVRAGDLILHIKDDLTKVDEDTVGMSLQEAVSLIRGKKGTPVTLSLYREDKGTFEVTIVRDTIVVPSVEYEIGDWQDGEWQESATGSVVWVKLRRFGDRTEKEWDEMVTAVKAKSEITGMVLDVRNNPGGYLQGAIDLASEFIDSGVIVQQQGRYQTETYEVSRQGRLLNMPIVVLINGGSASASEILAGALRDRKQTPLVGEQSFGKGTVQEAPDLPGGAGLHVTIARWLLPNGGWIHENGLKPDFEVELPEISVSSQSEASTSATPEENLRDTQLEKAIEVLQQ